MDDDRQSLLDAARATLDGWPGLQLAMLVGSVARGTHRPDSDVDVAVRGRGLDVLDIAAELAAATGREVDVIDLEHASIPMLDAVLRDGVLLVEAQRGAWGLWRSHTLATLELDRPWFERQRDAWLQRLVGG